MLNEIITAGGVDYTVQNISTGLNTISFVVPEMTVDEAETAFKSVTALTVKTKDGEVYGKYPNVAYASVLKDADGNVSIAMRIPSQMEPDISDFKPYEPTLEELQEQKIREMNNVQQQVIKKGVDVTLADGTVEHFTLKDQDQTSLMGLQSQVAAGVEQIPWHNSDESEHCKFYSNADMTLIVNAAMQYVTYHITYFRDLRIYIRSLTVKEDVQSIYYGVCIPEEYQSEPLKTMIAAQA